MLSGELYTRAATGRKGKKIGVRVVCKSWEGKGSGAEDEDEDGVERRKEREGSALKRQRGCLKRRVAVIE